MISASTCYAMSAIRYSGYIWCGFLFFLLMIHTATQGFIFLNLCQICADFVWTIWSVSDISCERMICHPTYSNFCMCFNRFTFCWSYLILHNIEHNDKVCSSHMCALPGAVIANAFQWGVLFRWNWQCSPQHFHSFSTRTKALHGGCFPNCKFSAVRFPSME